MRYLKYGLGILIGIIVLLIVVVRFTVHESRPELVKDKDADALAQKMLGAVNIQAWDTLSYIKWTFRGAHHYVWDKENNNALIEWDDYTVHLDPDQITGKVLKGGKILDGDQASKGIETAWSYWCNDMFWLAAPFKIKDPGVELNVAKDSEGKEGLLASYSSGGVTPGDAYLWYLDDNGRPTGYKMWVKIIPIGGVYTSWEDWITLQGGTSIASTHQGNVDFLRIEITNISGGQTWEDLGYEGSPITL